MGELYETVYGAVARFLSQGNTRRSQEEADFRMPTELPPFVGIQEVGRVTKALAELLSSYLGASWLVEVRK